MKSELHWRWISGAVCLLFAHSAWAGSAIHLKNRMIGSLAGSSGRLGTHYMLQFRSYPDAGVRAELARRGVRVLGYIPDSTLMVASAGVPDLEGLDVQSAGSLNASDKLSPLLAQSRSGAILVMLYPDVNDTVGRELIGRQGFVILPRAGLLPGHFLVAGPARNLAELAASDEVSYIMPASPDLLSGAPLMACAGALTNAGVMAQYVEVSQGWPQSPTGDVELNYTFQSFTPELDENAIRTEVDRALAEWARYTNLNFSEGSDALGARTINIRFASGSHGDAYPFDGPGGMLAHTFYPAPPNREPIAGDLHLDADERWQIGSGIDLFSVALHEAGHALGLGHTDNPDSVMYPYYRILAGLSVDDMAGIRALYGSRNATPPPDEPIDPPTAVTPPSEPSPSLPTLTPPFSPPATPTVPSPSTPDPAPPITPPVPSPTPPQAPTVPPTATPNATPPSMRITMPGSTISSTTATSITVAGTAADSAGITVVKWTTSTGGSGVASGTTNWSAQVPLLTGDNVIIVRTYDTAGNSAWRAITVVRR